MWFMQAQICRPSSQSALSWVGFGTSTVVSSWTQPSPRITKALKVLKATFGFHSLPQPG